MERERYESESASHARGGGRGWARWRSKRTANEKAVFPRTLEHAGTIHVLALANRTIERLPNDSAYGNGPNETYASDADAIAAVARSRLVAARCRALLPLVVVRPCAVRSCCGLIAGSSRRHQRSASSERMPHDRVD